MRRSGTDEPELLHQTMDLPALTSASAYASLKMVKICQANRFLDKRTFYLKQSSSNSKLT